MIIGIISYLPMDKNVRQKRLEAHHKQLQLLSQLNCKMFIVAQNYTDEDYCKNNNIKYFKFDKGIGPSKARNILLDYFYNSDEDWMLMCDDDRYFYDYYDIFTFFNELQTNPYKFMQLDYIRSHMATKLPFKKSIYEQPLNLTHYVFEDRQTINDTGLAIIKNFKKYCNKEIYYEDIKAENGEGYEDKDFCCKLKLNNISTHILNTFISGSYNYDDNSTLFIDMQHRLNLHLDNNKHILDKYKDTNLFINGRLNKKYKNNPVIIAREHPITISDNLIPKYENKNTLF